MKTIFYIPTEQENGEYWFDNKPYKEWFALENTLYEPTRNINRRGITFEADKKIIKSVTITQTKDTKNFGTEKHYIIDNDACTQLCTLNNNDAILYIKNFIKNHLFRIHNLL